MSFITDRQHLMAVAEGIIDDARALAVAWLEEDHAACAPRSSGEGGPISGGGRSNPTGTIATGRDPSGDADPMLDDPDLPSTDQGKYRDRDRLGSDLLHVADKLRRMVEDRKPRDTGGPCRCCDEHTATHGRTEDGRPWACFACYGYFRRWGRMCNVDSDGQPTDRVHRDRPPPPKFCACPSWCCETCHDAPADGRSVSERCKSRMRPDRQTA